MNTTEIKAAINAAEGSSITNLLMQNQKATLPGSTTEVPTDWFSHWEDKARIRVSMHKDVLAAIKAQPTRGDLVIKKQLVDATATRAAYIRYIVVIPAEIEAVL